MRRIPLLRGKACGRQRQLRQCQQQMAVLQQAAARRQTLPAQATALAAHSALTSALRSRICLAALQPPLPLQRQSAGCQLQVLNNNGKMRRLSGCTH